MATMIPIRVNRVALVIIILNLSIQVTSFINQRPKYNAIGFFNSVNNNKFLIEERSVEYKRKANQYATKLDNENKNDDKKENKKQIKKNKNSTLGGDTSTRNIFAITEIFGTITSLFQPNKNENENENLEEEREMIPEREREMDVESVNMIAENIRKEYEDIFWAVSLFSFDFLVAIKIIIVITSIALIDGCCY
jgi:hypothetical protein